MDEMNYNMKIETIEDAEKFFKLSHCSWFYIDRETNRRKDLEKLNISKDLFDKWTWEFINERLDKLDYSKPYEDILYALKYYMGFKLSYELVLRIYNIFIKLYKEFNDDTLCSHSTIGIIIQDYYYFSNKERPFDGLLGYLYNDKEKVKLLSEILIKELKFEDEYAFKSYMSFALYNLYYGLDYSKELHNIFIAKAKERYYLSMEYGESEWPMICYLDGYVVEKNYINAYRAIRMSIEKNKEIGNITLSNIELVNKIANMKYTVDDVLKLPPLRDSYKKTKFDEFIEQILKE